MQKVTTFLWFESGVEEAVQRYTSLLPDSEVLEVQRFGGEMPGGLVVVRFRLAGVEYQAGSPSAGRTAGGTVIGIVLVLLAKGIAL